MEDWDLQAIVKGCTRPTSTTLMDDPFFSFLGEEDEFSFVYPELFETTATSHGFEGLSASLYPVLHPLIPHPDNNSSSSVSDLRIEFKEPGRLHQKKQVTPTKLKASKKSRQNRVVKEVRADSVCSDSWGWRKYGQKPIKGSPHPRSYYRCSSSKGCSARKQVERSHSDPDVFVVTYTAEHNHAEPTRRNALAGTTRKKFPTPENTHDMNGFVPSHDMVLSPHSTSAASNEVDQPVEGVAAGGLLINMPFEISSEDLFPGWEDFLF